MQSKRMQRMQRMQYMQCMQRMQCMQHIPDPVGCFRQRKLPCGCRQFSRLGFHCPMFPCFPAEVGSEKYKKRQHFSHPFPALAQFS